MGQSRLARLLAAGVGVLLYTVGMAHAQQTHDEVVSHTASGPGAPAGYEGLLLRAVTDNGALEAIATWRLRPSEFNARRYFDPEALTSLANSLLQHGQLQPIVVRRVDPDSEGREYEVIAGERRYRAAALANLPTLNAYVVDASDAEARRLMLAENLQRTDLTPWDELQSILRLLVAEFAAYPHWERVVALQGRDEHAAAARIVRAAARTLPHDPDGAAASLGMDPGELRHLFESVFDVGSNITLQSFVRLRLPLLRWPADVREALESGKVPFASAQLIKGEKDPAVRQELFERIKEGRFANTLEIRDALQVAQGGVSTAEDAPTPANRLTTVGRRYRRVAGRLDGNGRRRVEKLLRELETLLERYETQ